MSTAAIDPERQGRTVRARARIQALTRPAPPGPAWLEEITVIVKAFERPTCVANLLESIRAHYPALKILVCDDSREPLFANEATPAPGIRWLTLPFAAGHTVGAGRNHLVRHVATPLLFLADDDHVFNRHTRLDVLRRVLEQHRLDFAGGAQDRGDYGGAVFEERAGVVHQRFHEFHEELEPGVVRCDRISNTFLARTAAVRAIGWEERVHAAEHADFFLRASRAGRRIAQVGYVYVDHVRDCEQPTGWAGRWLGRWLPHRDREYARLRGGADVAGEDAATRERKYVLEKNGVTAIVDVRNQHRRRALERRIGDPFYLPEAPRLRS